MKIVGNRRTSEDLTPIPAEEALRRAAVLQAQAELLNPFPRPRGFVFKPGLAKNTSAGANPSPIRGFGKPMAYASPLLRVCQLLDETSVQVCILHDQSA